MNAGAVLHVVFNRSAAASLRKALDLAGCDDPVIGLSDNFSFGPIASENAGDRAIWMEEVFRDLVGYASPDDLHDANASFLAKSRSGSRLNAWVSQREAGTYAGYLWWLSHMGDVACAVTDVPRLSHSQPEQLVHWLDQSVPLTSDELSRRQKQWRDLQSENSDLRIIVGDDLVSKPLNWFDGVLLGLATDQWQRMASIVGLAIGATSEDEVYQVGDGILGARLASLASAGALEWRGDLGKMRECELRLPPPPAP